MMKEKERLAYLDKDKAEEERVKGNELFTQGNVLFFVVITPMRQKFGQFENLRYLKYVRYERKSSFWCVSVDCRFRYVVMVSEALPREFCNAFTLLRDAKSFFVVVLESSNKRSRKRKLFLQFFILIIWKAKFCT